MGGLQSIGLSGGGKRLTATPRSAGRDYVRFNCVSFSSEEAGNCLSHAVVVVNKEDAQAGLSFRVRRWPVGLAGS